MIADYNKVIINSNIQKNKRKNFMNENETPY